MNYWPAEEARRQTRWYDCAFLSSNQRRREGRREKRREEGRTDKENKRKDKVETYAIRWNTSVQ